MNNKNSEMIGKIYEERREFVVIGLTGRTGSGCTTTAAILTSTLPSFPKEKYVKFNGDYFFLDLIQESMRLRLIFLSQILKISYP